MDAIAQSETHPSAGNASSGELVNDGSDVVVALPCGANGVGILLKPCLTLDSLIRTGGASLHLSGFEDLADTFASDAKLVADLREGLAVAVHLGHFIQVGMGRGAVGPDDGCS